MAISFRRYVDITSGVGAGARVPGRELIGRIFTTNPLAPTDVIIEFSEAREVADFFGSGSEEYWRAAFYFGFISKTQVRPRKLGFVRFVQEAAAATLRGQYAADSLDAFKKIRDGSFVFHLNGVKQSITGRDFSKAKSYADVASGIESGLRAADSDPFWSTCTVSFDPVNNVFIFKAGSAGDCDIKPAGDADEGTPLAAMLRWSAASGALASKGYGPQSVTDTLNRSTDQSNNFGSFLFMCDLSLEQMKEAADFAHLSNVQFKYCQRVSTAEAAGVREALKGCDGTALTEYDPEIAGEFPEMAPMLILAGTDYTRRNGTQNYMFYQLNLTPTVMDNTKANQLDALRVNYYGRTQQAGQLRDFYQRGVLQGNIQDMNIYANEMWLKDRAGADIMSLKLALPEVAANDGGIIQVTGCLQSVIAMALDNGVISISKPLTYQQKAFITEVTGDVTAWVEVQSNGYWLRVQIKEETRDDRVEYKAVYLLIYAKKDLIRKTEGTHSLI